MSSQPYRVAALTTHPIQYQAPLFRYLAASPGIDLTVLFLSDLSVREYSDPGFGVAVGWDVPLLEGYRHEFLRAAGGSPAPSFWRPFTRAIRARLAAGRFNALWVHGYAHQALLRAIAAAKSLRIPVLLRGDSHLGSESRSPVRRAIKRAFFPRLLASIDALLAIGTLNREYYAAWGAPAGKIFTMPYAVDNDFFRERAAAARPRRDALRAELGLAADRPIILFASKMQARKRARDLLEAYARLAPGGSREPHPYLLFVGDGAQRAALEARVGELGWRSVVFAGFRNQTELPRYYDLCDVLVLPSEAEPWGLVLNEVMNAAKPVIASDQVGAAADLIADGDNGFIYPVGGIDALAARLRAVIGSPERAAAMGARSLVRVSEFSFDADRRGLLDALAFVTGRSAAGAGI